MIFGPITKAPAEDWKTPSRALVASDGKGNGCVLWTEGPHVQSMIDEAGVAALNDIGLDDAPKGLSIWEGVIRTSETHTPDSKEYDSWLSGDFRPLKAQEWATLQTIVGPPEGGAAPSDTDDALTDAPQETTPPSPEWTMLQAWKAKQQSDPSKGDE